MNNSTQVSRAAALATEEPAGQPGAGRGRPVATSAAPLLFTPEEVQHFIEMYVANPLFADTDAWIVKDNPYRRPVDQRLVPRLDFTRPLARGKVFGPNALAAHRMLLNIYETDLIFLPEEDFAAKRADFARYYNNENKLLGELVRPTLEAHVYGFLEDEIDVTGRWTLDALLAYFQSALDKHEQTELDICRAILASRDPEHAARFLLVQVAGDFLSEASASARNVLGKYGPGQSELFKIVIDDFGYGVHRAKHSTLFENTLATCGLLSDAHAYWLFYLGSSLAINNYYHYVSRDHGKFFRALGAIAYAESMFSHTCRKISEVLRAVFGKAVDTYYFDEHYHIDAHHGRMAVQHVVAPAIVKYGAQVIPEIVRGMEELRLLTALNDEDFIAQLAWADAAEGSKETAARTHQKMLDAGADRTPPPRVAEPGQPRVTQVNDRDLCYFVESGALDVLTGHDRAVRLGAGEGVVVPRGRLHGVTAVSGPSSYHVHEMGE